MDQNDDCHTLSLEGRSFLSGPVSQCAIEDSKTMQDKPGTHHQQEISIIKKRESSDAINTQSIVISHKNSVQESAEPLNCDINNSLRQRNDDVADKYELLVEGENLITNKRIRLTKTEQSDLPTGISDNKEEADSSLPDLHNGTVTSLDQPVDLQFVSPCFLGSMSGKGLTAGNDSSMEDVQNTLLMETSDGCLGIEKSTSSGDNELLVDKSNPNTNETKRDSNLFLHLDDNEKSLLVAKNASTINEVSCDSDKLASNLLVELNDEAKKTVSNVYVHIIESKEGTIDRYRGKSSCDTFERDNPQHMGGAEEFLASDGDSSLTQLDDRKGVASQIIGADDNVAVGRSFAGCKKKLLVLDVNGLLVDISSYVPYDYDPDEILLKKAIFKRPYCDEFLKFCFERFEVGVWTSRTKSNMEPILDYLFGNDKHKLLFRWDQWHCTYTCFKTVEKRHKPLILKKLKKLWEKFEPSLPWKRGEYNETNTLLIDDSPYKAICNPRHTAIFPYTYRFRHVKDNSLGPRGDLRVYLEGLAEAENVQEYVKQNPFGQRAITEKNLSWGFYSKVIEAWTSPPRETADDDDTSACREVA